MRFLPTWVGSGLAETGHRGRARGRQAPHGHAVEVEPPGGRPALVEITGEAPLRVEIVGPAQDDPRPARAASRVFEARGHRLRSGGEPQPEGLDREWPAIIVVQERLRVGGDDLL